MAFRVGKWGPNVGTFMKIAVVVLFTVLFTAFLIQHGQPHGASTAAGPEAIAERSAAAIGILVFLWVGFELPNGAGQGAENPALSQGSHSGSGGRCVPGRPGVTARLGRRRHHLAQGADGGSAAGPEGIDMAGTARTVPPRGGARCGRIVEARVPIGETLAVARQRAGLSVAQVSERTRIRETIIRGIEDDDYSACGGDFYARGHIRAIAKVVGTDSEPLIREYDTLRRAPGAAAAVSLEELVATSAQAPQRRRPDLPAVWAVVAAGCVSAWRRVNVPAVWALVAAGCVSAWRRVNVPGMRELATQAYRSSGRRVNLPAVREVMASAYASARRKVNPPAMRALVASGYASARRKVNLPAVPGLAAHACRSGGRRVNWTAALGLALIVVLSFGVYRLLSGPPQAAVAPSAASRHAAAHHHPRHSRPNPAPRTSQAAVPPSVAPGVPAQTLTPIHAAAFGPGGGDNPQLAHLAIGGHRAAGWHTDWYTSARFGNLYPGTGLLLDMGRPVTVTAAQITLGSARGASLQVRIGAKPALTAMPPAAHVSGTGGTVRLRLTTPAHGRYVLVWFTRLPADPAGTFQALVYNVSLQGHP